MSNKTYVVDTNVIIASPKFFDDFENTEFILPIITLEELDKIKSRDGVSGFRARQFFRFLKEGDFIKTLSKGVELDYGNTLKTTIDYDLENIPENLDKNYGDNKILALEIFKDDDKVLLTADISLLIKAESMGISVEVYEKSLTKTLKDLEKGYSEVVVTQDMVDKFYKEKKLHIENIIDDNIYPNKFYIARSLSNEKSSFIGRYDEDYSAIVPLEYGEKEYYGVKAKDTLQKFAIEGLANPKIKLFTMSASQGVGKTYLSMAVGLDLVEDKQAYDKVLVGKNTAPIDKWSYQGFTTGDTENKLLSHFSNYSTTLENLDKNRKGYGKKDNQSGTDLLQNRIDFIKSIEVLDIASILGSSFSKKYIIIDEAGSIPLSTARSILTRAHDDSKLVYIGDIMQQTENRVDPDKSGLYCAIDWLKSLKETGHITMENVYRGNLTQKVSEIFNKKMFE